MTIMPRRHVMGLFILFGLIAVLLLMPLRVAAGAMGLSARSSQGSVMSGSLRDASVGRVRIGDIYAQLRILSIFTGRFSFALKRGDAPHAPGVSGTLGRSLNGPFADRLSATLDGGGLIKSLDGSELRLESLSFAFAGGKCSSASGLVRLRLDDSALGAVIRGALKGNAECRNGDLFLPLISDSTMERALVRIKGDGRYQLRLLISEPSAEIGAALGLAGFQPVAGGFRIVRSGKLN